ncbi:transposable element Tcb2 transposase [Trichonephila clavipes]|nr:transposable element Tcb2 transposase [Trichonephila clavipes]
MGTSGPKVVSRLWNQFQTSDTVTRKITTEHRHLHRSLLGIKHTTTLAPQLAHDLAAVSRRRILWQIVYSGLAETGLYARYPVCDESKCTKQSDSRRVFTCRENRTRFHASYEKKIDRFGGKEILVRSCIMLRSRTPLYVFYANTVNSQGYRDEILEAYVTIGLAENHDSAAHIHDRSTFMLDNWKETIPIIRFCRCPSNVHPSIARKSVKKTLRQTILLSSTYQSTKFCECDTTVDEV